MSKKGKPNQPPTPRPKRTDEQLRADLVEQRCFLINSSKLFDAGAESEAKRLATTLRVLLHDTSTSHALLAQLGVLNELRFMDTATPVDPENLMGTPALAIIEVRPAAGARWRHRLDDEGPGGAQPPQPFTSWWNAAVLRDEHNRIFSRQRLVRVMSNTDGGAHVDPRLDVEYEALKTYSSRWEFTWEPNDGGSYQAPFDNNVVFVSVRQIAHEVLRTLDRIEWVTGLGPAYAAEALPEIAGPRFPGTVGNSGVRGPRVPVKPGERYRVSAAAKKTPGTSASK